MEQAQFYNLKVTYYNGSIQYKFYKKPVNFDYELEFEVVSDPEEVSSGPETRKNKDKQSVDIERSMNVSINRSINQIYNYARANKWDYMVTFTMAADKVDRFNYTECKKKLCKLLNNWKNRKCPNLKYLIVHEMHKDNAFHFHGLIANPGSLIFEMARNPKNNKVLRDSNLRTIYNIKDFTLGFCTATKVSDTYKASAYICKYISKQLSIENYIPNIQRYFVSKNCNLPETEIFNINQNEFFKFMSNQNVDFSKIIQTDYNTVYLYEINCKDEDS